MKKLLLILVLFLIIGGFVIKLQNDLNLEQDNDRKVFVKEFTTWLFQVGKNVFELTGQASRQDWLPDEEKNNTIFILKE